jgi:hypothetical protein
MDSMWSGGSARPATHDCVGESSVTNGSTIERWMKGMFARARIGLAFFDCLAALSLIVLLLAWCAPHGQEYIIFGRSGGHCVEISHDHKTTIIIAIANWPATNQPLVWRSGIVGVPGPEWGLTLDRDPNGSWRPGFGGSGRLWIRPNHYAPINELEGRNNSSLIPVPVRVSIKSVEDWQAEMISSVLPVLWVLRMSLVAIKRLLEDHRRRNEWRHRLFDTCVKCNYDMRATPDRCPECGTIPPWKETSSNTPRGAGG